MNTVEVLEVNDRYPQICGQYHGEHFRKKIKEVCQLKIDLTLKMTNLTKKDLDTIALKHVSILKKFDLDLYNEIAGIAQGSLQKLTDIIILNNYTDIRDLRANKSDNIEDGCTLLYVPTDNAPLLGQTWDIDASSTPYVVLMKIKHKFNAVKHQNIPEFNGEIVVLSIAGCVGMAGMSSRGLGVAINNLNSYNANIGVVWPALVRKILKQDNAVKGASLLKGTNVGSGHYYFIADRSNAYGFETNAWDKKIIHSQSDKTLIHTNHPLTDKIAKQSFIKKGSTTYERYYKLKKAIKINPPNSIEKFYNSFAEVAMMPKKQHPQQTATCAAIAFDLKNLDVVACGGAPSIISSQHCPLRFKLKSQPVN